MVSGVLQVFGACILLVYLPVNVGIVEFLRASCVVMPGGEGAPLLETPTPVLENVPFPSRLETLSSYLNELRSGLSPG